MRKCWILNLDNCSTSSYLSSFQAFSYRNLDTSSTPGRSIEQIYVPSTPAWHLLDNCIYQSLKLDTCYLSRFKKEIEILICFLGIYECVFGTSFLLTLDIYKAYFRGRQQGRTYAKGDRWLILFKRSYCIFAPSDFVIKCFLIFIVNEVKNFAANNLLKLVIKSYTGIRAIS